MALLSGRAGGVSAMIGADFDGNGFVGIACCLEICGENLEWPEYVNYGIWNLLFHFFIKTRIQFATKQIPLVV